MHTNKLLFLEGMYLFMWLKKHKTEINRSVIFSTEAMKNEFIDECTKISRLPESQRLPESLIDDFLIRIVKIFEVNTIFFITVQKKEENCWNINDFFLICRFDFENHQIVVTGGERGVYSKRFTFNSGTSSFVPDIN